MKLVEKAPGPRESLGDPRSRRRADRRRRPDGGTEFLRRPVSDYVVPVQDVVIPDRAPKDVAVIFSVEPRSVLRVERAVELDEGALQRSPRMLELLELAEQSPDLVALAPFLGDPDPQVRREAVATVTEVVPEGTGPALAGALLDPDDGVRAAAATALRELVEVIPAADEVRVSLLASVAAVDAVSRAAVLDVLGALKLGSREVYRAGSSDDDHRVRLQAVRGLVSLDDVPGVAESGADAAREVRMAAAHGLGTIGADDGIAHLVGLAGDPEPLVRFGDLVTMRWWPRPWRRPPVWRVRRSCGAWPSPASTQPSGRSGWARCAAWPRHLPTSAPRHWSRWSRSRPLTSARRR